PEGDRVVPKVIPGAVGSQVQYHGRGRVPVGRPTPGTVPQQPIGSGQFRGEYHVIAGQTFTLCGDHRGDTFPRTFQVLHRLTETQDRTGRGGGVRHGLTARTPTAL